MNRRSFIGRMVALVGAAAAPIPLAVKAAPKPWETWERPAPIPELHSISDLREAIEVLFRRVIVMEPRSCQEMDGWRVVPQTFVVGATRPHTQRQERALLESMYSVIRQEAESHVNQGGTLVWRKHPHWQMREDKLVLRCRMDVLPTRQMREAMLRSAA